MRRILVVFILIIAALVVAIEQTEINHASSNDNAQLEIKQSQNQPGGVTVIQVSTPSPAKQTRF